MAISREQVVQTAEKFVSRGKIEAAIREYKKVLAENPNDANTLNRVGDLYARIQRFDEAVDFFGKIAEQYTEEGFFVKAIAIYKKIIKLNPTHLEVYEKLAELYHKQGLVNEARTQYLVLADYYQKHDNPTSAIAIYQKMVALEPENPTYHVKLAELYQQQKLIEKALTEHRIIAELMLAHGHAQEAAQVYERGLDIDALNMSFISDAVQKLRESGAVGAAARFLAAAVERNPEAESIARQVRGEAAEPAAPAPPARPSAPLAPSPPAASPAPPPAPVAAVWSSENLGLSRDLLDSHPVVLPTPAEMDGDPFASMMTEAEPAYPELEAVAEEAAQAAAVPEEFDLDLDDVFVLDIEDEAEPASLVKPPADMLGEAPRRPAWAQAPEEEREEPAAVDTGDDTQASLRPAPPPAPQASPPPPAPPASPPPRGALPAPPKELDLDDRLPAAAFELELDLEPLSMEEEPAAPAVPLPAPVPAPPPAAPVKIDPELLERTAAELHPPVHALREEDLVTEAEVLAKYGLEEKALERLREALRMDPRHLGAYALMIQINLDKGRHGRVLELANQMSKIAARSDRDPWLKVRKRLLAAGFRLDGDQVAAPPQPREAAGDGVDELLRGILGKGAPKKAPPPRPAAAAAAKVVPEAPAAPPLQMVPPSVPAPLASAPPAAAIPAPAAASPPPPAAVEPPPPPAASPAAPPALPIPPIPPIVPIAPGEHFNLLEIGKLVEAEDLGEPEAAFVPEVPPPPLPAAAAPTAAPGAPGLDDTGMSWLDEVDSSRRKRVAGEEDFFDLAGELEQELSREESFHGSELLVQPAEQSLEQIVEGFKKGVAENLSPTDYDTHFNLGIAYREMGLLDEAIGEFQLAAKAPELLVPCCSMLGLCFLDKGLPELAIKWYRRGLESPRASEDDSLGLLYDMGNVYESLGDVDSAYKTFVEIYGVNTNYRDVVARIEELGRSR